MEANSTSTFDDPRAPSIAEMGSTPESFSFGELLRFPVIVGFLAAYIALCSAFRYRNIRLLEQRMRFTDRASLASMTNDQAQLILQHTIEMEFPMLYELSMQFALFKTYGVESISKMINSTKNLSDPVHSFKRYEDTTIIFGEFSLNPPSSDRAIKAIARMNFLHEQYKASGHISNADLLYTLAVCVTEPIRFMKLYEWRAFTDMEVCAIGTFWKSLGDAMGIEYGGFLSRANQWRDGIDFAEDITAWSKTYELEMMKPARSNMKPSRQLVKMMLWHVPKPFKALAQEILIVLMGDRVRDAFLYPEPSIMAAFAAYSALIARRFLLRFLALPRFTPRIFFSPEHRDTGRIHHFHYLVHPYYNPPTLRSRFGPVSWVTRILGGYVPGSPGMHPDGYLFEELGPHDQVGKGMDKMGSDMAEMKRMNRGGCPFSRL